jgi:hypothetical protein
MDDDTRTDYKPTPEGKEWLDSLGPEVMNIALIRDDQRPSQATVEFMNWQMTEVIRAWVQRKPHNIMQAL